MSADEKYQLDLIQELLEELKSDVGTMRSEMETVRRGVYGDKANGVKGLIQTNIEQQAAIDSLKEDRKKFMWTMAALVMAFQGAVVLFKVIASQINH